MCFHGYSSALENMSDRDYRLGLEACAALAHATWFAEYLERKFTAVRMEERERCVRIAQNTYVNPPYDPSVMRDLIVQRIRETKDE